MDGPGDLNSTDDAPAVVLLHGLGCAASIWEPVVELLAGDHRVHALDLPGAGRSPRLEGDLTVARLAAAVARHIESHLDGEVVLVGHSLGGMVAQEIALAGTAPQLRGLVLVDTIPGADARVVEINSALAGLVDTAGAAGLADAVVPSLVAPGSGSSGEHSAVVHRTLRELFAAAGAARLAAELRAICGFDATNRLPALHLPTLVVAGEAEANLDVQRRIADLVPGAAFEVLAGAGHMAPFEAPAAFVDLLRRFLPR